MQVHIPVAFASTSGVRNSLVPQAVIDAVDRNFDQDVRDICNFFCQPSVSATGEGMVEAADGLLSYFKQLGFAAQLIGGELGGYPSIYAEISGERPETLLIYGHYDVQPPDPLEEWEYPPFSATIVGNRIYARGSVDDKGNFLCALKAVEAYLKAGVPLPLNIKFLLEGEEEIGSPHFKEIAENYRTLLTADALLAYDGNIPKEGRSELVLGTKGMLFVELISRGAPKDLHSAKATIVENPAWQLIQALALIKEKDGHVNIPHFYDGVKKPESADLEIIYEIDLTDDDIRKEIGVEKFKNGLSGKQLKKALYFEPTCNISGLTSGYQGKGNKTVLPSEARAKIDIRLVPGQDPESILNNLRSYLKSTGFEDIEVLSGEGMASGKTSTDSLIAQCAYLTLHEIYGQPPVVKPLMEASGPGYVFSDVLQLPWAWVRLGPPENRMHAPNEYTTLKALRMGIEAVIAMLNNYASMSAKEAFKERIYC
ncbi:MAG TPA: M20/M25/M40 family metallo-hydrolase [Desulfosporosinus sp.]|nr:M20/M25/M40 family metallo-hydrolase [Desulfosporosinus sp.]